MQNAARRVKNRRESNGKLIHRARSSYFSVPGVVMNIKLAGMRTTTMTLASATKSGVSASASARQRARDIMRYTQHAPRPQRDDQRAVKRASAAMIF
ncbi:hypothetical protein PUN28_017416 [Cardiocondyla obscurior]|uniref:Uncharacterized protein n=1 Tax=Cardiocondyla obscurior TaxID=286306 RepID=A0AAW2EQZ4_9HYME